MVIGGGGALIGYADGDNVLGADIAGGVTIGLAGLMVIYEVIMIIVTPLNGVNHSARLIVVSHYIDTFLSWKSFFL